MTSEFGRLDTNRFYTHTLQIPRPDRSQSAYAQCSDAYLEEKQELWDQAENWRLHDAATKKARREADEADREVRRAAAADAQAERIRTETLGRLKTQYLAAGGTNAEWLNEDHDALLREHARQRALGGGLTPSQQQQAAFVRSRF